MIITLLKKYVFWLLYLQCNISFSVLVSSDFFASTFEVLPNRSLDIPPRYVCTKLTPHLHVSALNLETLSLYFIKSKLPSHQLDWFPESQGKSQRGSGTSGQYLQKLRKLAAPAPAAAPAARAQRSNTSARCLRFSPMSRTQHTLL